MKFLFTSTYYLPYISGMTIHEQRLAEALVERNHTVVICTSRHKKDIPIFEKNNGVLINRVPTSFQVSKGFIMPLYPFFLWKHIRNSYVVVSHLPQFESIIVAIIAALQRKPFYVIYHCEVVLPVNFTNIFIQKLLDIIHFTTLLFAKRVITYTQDYARHSRIMPYFKKKLVSIYPPVPVLHIDIHERKKLQQTLTKKPTYVLGVAARFAVEKGIDYLLTAIPLLEKKIGTDFIILFAGSKHPVGEEEYYQRMQHLLERYKKYIKFLGTISQKKMGSFYSLLDVLILPSVNTTEAFGMVQIEAMLCGVPVVVSDLPGVREPIRRTGMGELVKRKNSEELAEKIQVVLKNRKKYIRSRKEIENLFSIDDTINKYEKVFTEIS